MQNGLVLGKFMPLHNGHLALIDFALKQCEKLYILVCANDSIEPIPGLLRLQWVQQTFGQHPNIEICYTAEKIPYTSYSSRHISKLWATFIKSKFPDLSVFISSEKYGNYVAEYLGIRHQIFDEARMIIPVSATQIREKPLTYWNFIPQAVKPFFVKKICICGTESTGKSILTEKLATSFNTCFVPEMAREIPKKSEDFTVEDLYEVARLQAQEINRKVEAAHKIIFCDTGLDATKVYGSYFFGATPQFEYWIEEANQFDLYLLLSGDVPYVQDGTRLPENKRNEMHHLHYQHLKSKDIHLEIITGDWEQRFNQAKDLAMKNIINRF